MITSHEENYCSLGDKRIAIKPIKETWFDGELYHPIKTGFYYVWLKESGLVIASYWNSQGWGSSFYIVNRDGSRSWPTEVIQVPIKQFEWRAISRTEASKIIGSV